MSSLAMSAAANQAALAALAGLNQYQPATSKVLDRQVEALSQKLAAAVFECAAVCKQRKELQEKFCDLKEASGRTIAGLQEKLKKAEERLFTCQVEVVRFQQAVEARLADVQRRDQQHHQQVSALEAENVLLKDQANKVQLLLKEQTCQTKELERKLALQEQAAEAELSTVWKLVKYYQQQISDLEAEVLVWGEKQDKMKLLLQEQNYKIEYLQNKLARQAQAHQPTLLQFSSAKPPRWQPGHLVKQVQELTQEVEVKQQQISELQDELAELQFELSAMSTSTWGFDTPSSSSSTGSVKHTASMSTQTALEVCCDSEFEEEEEEQDAVQYQQAQVQVVFNLKESAVDGENLQALNSNLQQQLVVHQQLACRYEKDLAALKVKNQQLQQQNQHLEQLNYELDEKLVELEEMRPDVSLVVNVGDGDKQALVVEQEQPVITLAINVTTPEDTNSQAEVDDLRDQVAAVASRYQQEVEAVEVDNKQLQEQVNALQHLMVQREAAFQELEQAPKVVMVINVADGSDSVAEQVQLQVAELKHQVSELNESKQYLQAELGNREGLIMQQQQQLTAALRNLQQLKTPVALTDSADADTVIAAPRYLSAVRIKGSSRSRLSAIDMSNSQPGTPSTPALMECSSFAVGRGSSISTSSDDVVQHNREAEGYSCLGSTAAADHECADRDLESDDSTKLLISTNTHKESRHRTVLRSIRRRLTGPFVCWRTNSSSMVKEL